MHAPASQPDRCASAVTHLIGNGMVEPTDLVPLPTMPYSERPLSLPLDREECRTAVWRTRGNISEAAALLKVSSSRLRTFVKNSPYLQHEVEECSEILKDKALSIVGEALDDGEDKGRRDQMAKFVLTQIGQDRGFGKGMGKGGVNLNLPQGNFTITWEDGSNVNDNRPTIDGDIVDVG